MAHCPDQTSIDVTSDIIALLAGVQTPELSLEIRGNLFEPPLGGGDVPTRVQIP